MQHVHKIHMIEGFKIILEFDGGELRLVDFEPSLRNWASTPESFYNQLLDPAYFRNVKLYPEWRTLYWDNGIDFSAETLYELSQPIEAEKFN